MEEANAFAHRVTVLLEKYRLEEADIDFSNVGGQPAISQQEVDWGDYGLSPTRRRCSWLEGLATAVGRNNGTACSTPKTNIRCGTALGGAGQMTSE